MATLRSANSAALAALCGVALLRVRTLLEARSNSGRSGSSSSGGATVGSGCGGGGSSSGTSGGGGGVHDARTAPPELAAFRPLLDPPAAQAPAPAAPWPPLESEASDAAALMHALAALGHHDAALFDAVATLLAPELEGLQIEELVGLAWAYAGTLWRVPHGAHSGRRGDGDGEGINPSGGIGGRGDGGEGSGGKNGSGSDSGSRMHRGHPHVALLRALSSMLAAAVSPGRPDDLTPRELRLLWQAHGAAQQWAGGVDGVDASGGGSGGASSGGDASGGDARGGGGGASGSGGGAADVAGPLALGGSVLAAARDAAVFAAADTPRARARTAKDVAQALQDAGYEVIGGAAWPGPPGPPRTLAASLARDPRVVVADHGRRSDGAGGGRRRVALMLAAPGDYAQFSSAALSARSSSAGAGAGGAGTAAAGSGGGADGGGDVGYQPVATADQRSGPSPQRPPEPQQSKLLHQQPNGDAVLVHEAGAAPTGSGSGGGGAGAPRRVQFDGDGLIGEAALRLRLMRGLGWAAAVLPEAAWQRATSKGARGALLEELIADAYGAGA
ncbi:hypothetical protein FOA52_005334 [Chlamydomonas sp. UWO 241]|nr:hypothetical protein FOA52_005334 [Chlamydomonas sp. UWO 241]